MNRSAVVLTALASLALAQPTLGQGRHDEKAHGYDAAIAATAKSEKPARPATLAVGPRAHDNPLRFTTVEAALGKKNPGAVEKGDSKPETKQ